MLIAVVTFRGHGLTNEAFELFRRDEAAVREEQADYLPLRGFEDCLVILGDLRTVATINL
jgi:hypothetical protein